MLERARRPEVGDEDENRLARRFVKAGLGVPPWLRVSGQGVPTRPLARCRGSGTIRRLGLSPKIPATVGRGRRHPGCDRGHPVPIICEQAREHDHGSGSSGRGLGIESRCSAPRGGDLLGHAWALVSHAIPPSRRFPFPGHRR